MYTYAIVRRSDNRVLHLDTHGNEDLAQSWFERLRMSSSAGMDLALTTTMVVMDPDDAMAPSIGDEVIWDEDGIAVLA